MNLDIIKVYRFLPTNLCFRMRKWGSGLLGSLTSSHGLFPLLAPSSALLLGSHALEIWEEAGKLGWREARRMLWAEWAGPG